MSYPHRKTLIAAAILCALGGSTPLAACGDPCQELAEGTCQVAGSDSEPCKKVREMAASVSPDEREACDTALGLVKSLERTR